MATYEPYRLTQTGAQVQQDLNDVEALAPATIEAAGLMSAADKTKLDNLPSGSELSTSLSGKVDKVEGKGLSTNDYDNTAKSLVDSFPVAVEGLSRAIAEKYEMPNGGIPKSDLAQAVQTSLGKADSALQSQTQADWNESNSTDPAYIKNKPTIPAGVVVDQTYDGTSANAQSGVAMAGALATKQDTINDLSDIRSGAAAGATAVQPEAGKGLFSGNYNDLSNKPTIPAAQVNSDWNASSGVAQILNKPTIPTVPTISTDIATDGNDDTKTASPKAVKTYADTKYTKPSGGIPAADLASGVIPTVPTISTNIQTDKASDVKTASPKAVYDEVHPATGSSQPAGGMLPNVMYNLGTLTGSVTIAFASPTDNTIENEYKFGFTAGSTAPTITWPVGITWAGNSLDSTNNQPEIDADTYYEISVIGGHGIIAKFL